MTVNHINKKLENLKEQNRLNEAIYNRIRLNDATTAKFYGLPKIHKPSIPLR